MDLTIEALSYEILGLIILVKVRAYIIYLYR